MNFVSALYRMTRCVSTTILASCCPIFLSLLVIRVCCVLTLLCLLKYFLLVIYHSSILKSKMWFSVDCVHVLELGSVRWCCCKAISRTTKELGFDSSQG
jgi:hypothetical protein